LSRVESIIHDRPDSALFLLETIPRDGLNTEEKRAHYALLKSAALDKNYIDICSDSLISKAVDFYSFHGSQKEKMLSWYYQGICFKNARELVPAMLAFEKSEGEAQSLEEWFYLGLIYRNKASIFNLNNNNIAAIENWEKAILCFDNAGFDLYKAYAKLSLAIDYSNEKEYDKADSLLNQIGTDYSTNASLLSHCNLRKAGILVKKEIEPDNAIALFRKVPRTRYSVLDYGYLAQAFEMIGQRDSSDYWLEEGYRRFSDETAVASLDYMKAYIEKLRGHYREAYNLVNHAATVQDSLTRFLLQQSVSSAQRDYYKSETLLREERIRNMRQRNVFGVLLTLAVLSFLATVAISASRKKDSLLQVQMAKLALEERELEQVQRDNAYLVGSLFSERINHLDKLSETYFRLSEGKQKDTIFKQIKQLVSTIRKDDDLFCSLEQDLDRYCNHIMLKLRAQVPRIKGERLRMVMLFFAGFSYETVQLILNTVSVDSLKMARSRIRKDIKESHAPDAEFFLAMLEMKKRPQAGTNGSRGVR
jgi:hypothetical protein